MNKISDVRCIDVLKGDAEGFVVQLHEYYVHIRP